MSQAQLRINFHREGEFNPFTGSANAVTPDRDLVLVELGALDGRGVETQEQAHTDKPSDRTGYLPFESLSNTGLMAQIEPIEHSHPTQTPDFAPLAGWRRRVGRKGLRAAIAAIEPGDFKP